MGCLVAVEVAKAVEATAEMAEAAKKAALIPLHRMSEVAKAAHRMS